MEDLSSSTSSRSPPIDRCSGSSIADLIYLTEKDKYKALADEVERTNKWDVMRVEGRQRTCGERSTAKTTSEVTIVAQGRRIIATRAEVQDPGDRAPRTACADRHGQHRKERAVVGVARTTRHRARRCSTPSSTVAKRRSWPRQVASARSRSPRTWPVAVPTSSWAAIPRRWLGRNCSTSIRRVWKSPTMNGTRWSKRSTSRKR